MAVRDGDQVKKAQVEPHQEQASGALVKAPAAGTEFTRFKAAQPVGVPDRDPPGARVNISGLTTSNSGGTMLLDALVRKQGLSVDDYVLEYGYNLEKMQIALYPAHPKTVGAVKVRRNGDRKETVIYLKELFDQVPDLRPSTRRTCSLFADTDKNGEECVVLALNASLSKRRVPRKSSTAR